MKSNTHRSSSTVGPIPFNRPAVPENTLGYIRRALESGNTAGDGYFSDKCKAHLEAMIPGGTAFLTGSCTAALEMSAMVIGLQAGDEVIMPSFTYVSTANAFVRLGVTPVFVDICPKTFNLSPEQLENALSEKTRALVVVHYGGVPGEMAAYQEFTRKHGLVLIEDAAAAIGSRYHKQAAGSFGDLACFSFHETKNIACGQGGALIVNREEWIDSAQMIRDRGTDREAFKRGDIPAYTWQSRGSAFGMSELNAACLLAQLECFDSLASHREKLWQRYVESLTPIAASGEFELLHIPRNRTNNHHIMALLMPSAKKRQALQDHLNTLSILSVFHYQALHLSPMGREACRAIGPMEVTCSVADRLLRLPLFNDMTLDQVDRVCHALSGYFENHTQSFNQAITTT